MLLRLLGACALALALLIVPQAHAAGPLVTGKCWCGIGWGRFAADCGSKRVTCTKPMCNAACQARLPAKTSALTDVSSSRRLHRLRGADRHAGLRGDRPRSHASRTKGRAVQASRVDHFGADRDGRWRAVAHRAPEGQVRQPRAWVASVARQATQGAAVGGQVAVEHSRPRECYGIAWCGCWLRTVLGIPDRSLNLAINWARQGSPASPDSANVVVWRHHVGKLIAHEGGRILIQSGNDRGAVRTRWVSPGILGGVVAWRRV